MTISEARLVLGEDYQNEPVKEEISQELEDKMRLFVNMIIDRVLEDRKQGIIRY